MSTYQNNVSYVSVEEQAREDMSKILSAFGMALRIIAPVMLATAAIIMSVHYGSVVILAVAGITALAMMSHLGLAIVRFFGRNEERIWKRAFGKAWGNWAKWTTWPILCGVCTCTLMAIDDGVGATLNVLLMDAVGFILRLVG